MTGKPSPKRRGAKSANANVEAKRPAARKSRREGSNVGDLEKRLAEALKRETQASKREAETQEQQAATVEILRVISNSPADAQPVFDAIAVNALRLCDAYDVMILRMDGDVLSRVAHHGPIPPPPERVFAATRDTVSGRTVLDGRPIHVADLQAETEEFPVGSRAARQLGFRTVLSVPLLRDGVAIGVIHLRRTEVQPFTESQIALLQTFADQAVIAIENVRLFNEAKEALEQQTATADILRVISRSPSDIQPVFDAIASSATRLCEAVNALIVRFDGQLLHLVAHHNVAPERLDALERVYPGRANRGGVSGRVVLTHAVVHVEDVNADPEYTQPQATTVGYRTALGVPMLREGVAIGLILVARDRVAPFSGKQIALLQTFADQAVIAIENVRLVKELQEKNGALTQAHRQVTEALEQQTATSEVLRVIAGSPTDLQPVLDALVESASRLCQAADTFLLLLEGDQLRLAAMHGSVEEGARLSNLIHRGWVAGRAVMDAQTVHVEDLANAEAEFPLGAQIAVRFGHRTALAMPLVRKGVPIGALFLRRREVRPFSTKEIALLQTFADQAVIAIENVRLFTELAASNREIAKKSHQLEVASQHKSEFLANMSHELRTPLNAVIGFSEVLLQRMFGELNDKQDEYLKDIYASGQHLLSLINDILDLSKIEAGRMELEVTEFDLPTALDSALTLIRERAGRRGIALHLSVDERLGQLRADERKIRQVVLNLLSNAIKFTPEGGRIEVAAVPRDEFVEVSVSDTGIGIASEDQEAVFEEFRQVGTAAKKVEGTGLGLALSRRFIELHGGRIWVQSQVDIGSTFTFTIPVQRADQVIE